MATNFKWPHEIIFINESELIPHKNDFHLQMLSGYDIYWMVAFRFAFGFRTTETLPLVFSVCASNGENVIALM